jgi:hypothetical protein
MIFWISSATSLPHLFTESFHEKVNICKANLVATMLWRHAVERSDTSSPRFHSHSGWAYSSRPGA